MLGLTCADKRCSRLGYDLHRGIACILKYPPVSLPGGLVPARRTAYIKAAVFISDKITVCIQFPQNAGREAFYVLFTLRIGQKTAFESERALGCTGIVAGTFPDQELSAEQHGVSGDKAFCIFYGYNLRCAGVFFPEYGYRAFGITQVKSEKSLHRLKTPLRLKPAPSSGAFRLPSGRALRSRFSSRAEAQNSTPVPGCN